MARMKKLLRVCLAMLFLVVAAVSADDAQTVNGLVTDSRGGPKGIKIEAGCTQNCLANGAELVIVTDKKKVLFVDNPEALKGYGGQHVAVTGHMTVRHMRGTGFPTRSESPAIHVESVKPL